MAKKVRELVQDTNKPNMKECNEKIIQLIERETDGKWVPDVYSQKVKEQMERLARVQTIDYFEKLVIAILMRAKGLDTTTYDPEIESDDPKT